MEDTYFQQGEGRWAIGPHITLSSDFIKSVTSSRRRQWWFDTTTFQYISESYTYAGDLADHSLSQDPRIPDLKINGKLDLLEFSGHAIPLDDHLYESKSIMPKLIKCYNRVYRYVNSGDPLTSKTSYDIAARNLSNIASMLEPENHTYIKQQLARDMYFIDNDMMHYLNNTYRKYRLKNRDESSMKTLDGKYTNI